ncbi:Nn.00g054300.m01.CDS01 [Neocucurbitaria sp. VM-36]
MRKSTLRRTTLLSLIGLSTQQSTVTWGEPFTVDNSLTDTIPAATAAPTESTEALLSQASSPVPISQASSHALLTDSITPTPSPSPTAPVLSAASSDVTSVMSSMQSGVSLDSTFSVSLASPSGSSGTASTPVSQSVRTVSVSGGATESTGGAAAAATGYRKMGVVGALAGAAGVLLV